MGAALVSGVADQLPRFRLDAIGLRRLGRPRDAVSLGAGLRRQVGAAVRRHLRPCTGSWRVDETYLKVKGMWTYLYRAVDSLGQTIDFLQPSATSTHCRHPEVIAITGLSDRHRPDQPIAITGIRIGRSAALEDV